MHRRHRKDGNHDAIEKAFKKLGFSVQNTSQLGADFPDLVIAIRQRTALVEVKTEKGALSPGQHEFCRAWRGKVYVARSVADVSVIAKQIIAGI